MPDHNDLSSFLPPDAQPAGAKRGPGRPKGGKNRPKDGPATDPVPAVLPFEEAARPAPAAPPEPADPTLEAVAAALKERAAMLDFKRFGSQSRFNLTFVRDVSPSEYEYEGQWRAASDNIGTEINAIAAARNLVDVGLIHGAEWAELAAFDHGAEFRFPDRTRYGNGTDARPWMAATRGLVDAYHDHLAGLGIGYRDTVIVFATDFQFGGHQAALAAFKAWAKRKRATIVPAYFGAANLHGAQAFADEVPPVSLDKVSLGRFIQLVSRSVSRQSATRPGEGSIARTLADGFKAAGG